MTSSFSSKSHPDATTAASEQEPLCVQNDHRIQEDHPQCVSDPPTYCLRAAGVLRYNRESDDRRINLTTVLPVLPSLTEYAVKCEYCGEKARPSLDLTLLHDPETAPLFCCAQWQQLCEMLMKQRRLFEWTHDLKTGVISLEPTTRVQGLRFKGGEMEDHSKFVIDLLNRIGTQSETRIHEDYSIQIGEIFVPKTNVLRFQLSCAPAKGCWTLFPGGESEECLTTEEEPPQPFVFVPVCDHKPLRFGICHHQEVADCLHKYYSNGMKFLTLFHDGSAQVFYPSGLLALVIVVTEENGRVCIVYDDNNDPFQLIRAVFQSDGRATCYHSNGSVWLSLTRSSGQCLDETGARLCRWSWSQSFTPTTMHPVFLSLNINVGVRVLGRDQVFVSFLAQGQQAKFSVGTCCAQGESCTDVPAPGPSVMKDELLALAARIKINLIIQQFHQYLMKPSHLQLTKNTHTLHFNAAAQRLLEASAHVMMSDSERAFIHECLKDCL